MNVYKVKEDFSIWFVGNKFKAFSIDDIVEGYFADEYYAGSIIFEDQLPELDESFDKFVVTIPIHFPKGQYVVADLGYPIKLCTEKNVDEYVSKFYKIYKVESDGNLKLIKYDTSGIH